MIRILASQVETQYLKHFFFLWGWRGGSYCFPSNMKVLSSAFQRWKDELKAIMKNEVNGITWKQKNYVKDFNLW